MSQNSGHFCPEALQPYEIYGIVSLMQGEKSEQTPLGKTTIDTCFRKGFEFCFCRFLNLMGN
jgi:hypothetical protein